MAWEFEKKFGGGFVFDMCHSEQPCYDKPNKAYFLGTLTDDQIVALMKKSLADGHDYLLDAVKDNECPPLDPDCDY